MPSIEYWLPFLAATAIFAYMPGPALLYTAAQTLARGRRAGLMAALGIHLGGYVHVVAAALGLSAIFELVPEAYLALKICGAAYLVWLGVRIVRSRFEGEGSGLPVFARKTARRAFVESVSVEVLNPKTALFFVAFLPQFADPAAALPIAWQLLALGTIVNLAFSSADLVAILLTERVLGGLRRAGWGQRLARWAAGSIMVGLGARLAFGRD